MATASNVHISLLGRFATVFSILLILTGVVWAMSIGPELSKLPSTFLLQASIDSTDNFFDQKMGKFSGEIDSQTRFSYESKKKNGGELDVENVFDVRKPNGEKIFSVTRLYGIDAKTGKHLPGFGDHDRKGYLFAPANTGKQDYTYWHVNYDVPITMKFQDEQTILGLRVYHFSSGFSADQTKDLTNLPDVGKTKGIVLDVLLETWIEPVTGRMVKYQDKAIAYYYDLQTKQKLYPWNTFSNKFTPLSVEQSVLDIQNKIQRDWLLNVIIPAIFITFGMIMLIGSTLYIRKLLPPLLVPLFVFVLLLFVTVSLYLFVKDDFQKKARFQFESDTLAIEVLIKNRFDIYTNFLKSGVGLFAASDQVTRKDWERFVSSLDVTKNYPGIQGFGYAAYIHNQTEAAQIQTIRSDGAAQFQIKPDGAREAYVPVVYLEPPDARNSAAIGYDMYSEIVRKAAIDTAMKSGLPTLSGKVTLVQEIDQDVQPGFLLYLPVYRATSATVSASLSDREIKGFVYAPFRMNNVMNGLFQSKNIDIDFEIYDSSKEDPLTRGNLLYDSDASKYSGDITYSPEFSAEQALTLGGRIWTIRYISLPDYRKNQLDDLIPRFVLGIGMVINICISLLILSFANGKRRAERLAAMMTENLRESEQKYRSVFESLTDVLFQTTLDGKITMISPSIKNYTGITAENLIGRQVQDFYADPAQSDQFITAINENGNVKDFSIVVLGEQGRKLSVSLNAHFMFDEDHQPIGIEGLLRDVTEREKTSLAMAAKNDELEKLNKILINRELKMKELKNELAKQQISL